jgi:prepilin-type N-terminal cleavage/methylation domain-containing protein
MAMMQVCKLHNDKAQTARLMAWWRRCRSPKKPTGAPINSGMSLVEVLVALLISSSLIWLLTGALLSFAQISDRLQSVAAQRAEIVERRLLFQRMFERMRAEPSMIVAQRDQLLYLREAGRQYSTRLFELEIRQSASTATAVLVTDALAREEVFLSDNAEDVWFEYLSADGWSDTYPSPSTMDDRPAEMRAGGAAPIAFRVCEQHGVDFECSAYEIVSVQILRRGIGS